MWAFNIARDTMHQQQWLAVIEELGGHEGTLPMPNSFPQAKENKDFAYNFFSSTHDGRRRRRVVGPRVLRSTARAPTACSRTSRWAREPKLGPAPKNSMAEKQQIA